MIDTSAGTPSSSHPKLPSCRLHARVLLSVRGNVRGDVFGTILLRKPIRRTEAYRHQSQPDFSLVSCGMPDANTVFESCLSCMQGPTYCCRHAKIVIGALLNNSAWQWRFEHPKSINEQSEEGDYEAMKHIIEIIG